MGDFKRISVILSEDNETHCTSCGAKRDEEGNLICRNIYEVTISTVSVFLCLGCLWDLKYQADKKVKAALEKGLI